MDLHSIISKPDILKLQLYLNRTKDISIIYNNITLPIGEITYCTALQYTICQIYKYQERDEYKRAFYILSKHTDLAELDSNGNNVLFYAAFLDDQEIIKYLVDAKVPVCRNKDGKLAYEYGSNELLAIYCGKRKRTKLPFIYRFSQNTGKERTNSCNKIEVKKINSPDEKIIDETCLIRNSQIEDDENDQRISGRTDEVGTIEQMAQDVLRSDLLDLKPNKYETDIIKSESKLTMSDKAQIINDPNAEEDKALDESIVHDTVQKNIDQKDIEPRNDDEIEIEDKDMIRECHGDKINIDNSNYSDIKIPQDDKGLESNLQVTLRRNQEATEFESQRDWEALEAKTKRLTNYCVSEEANETEYEQDSDPYLMDLEADSNPDLYDYTVTRLDLKKLKDAKYNEIKPLKVRIKMFPGTLYVQIDSITDFVSRSNDIESVGVRVICNGLSVKCTDYEKEDFLIKYSNLLSFYLYRPCTKLKFIVVVKYIINPYNRFFTESRYRKVLEANYKIPSEGIIEHHNSFKLRTLDLERYKTRDIVKKFKDLFFHEHPTANRLKTYIAYVSSPEVPAGDMTTKRLINYLMYKENSSFLWYKGYVNIRGECAVATHLWKRRLVEWHGYHIVIFNEFSYKMVGVFDITGCKYLAINDDVLEYCVRLVGKEGVLELQVDNEINWNMLRFSTKKCLDAIID